MNCVQRQSNKQNRKCDSECRSRYLISAAKLVICVTSPPLPHTLHPPRRTTTVQTQTSNVYIAPRRLLERLPCRHCSCHVLRTSNMTSHTLWGCASAEAQSFSPMSGLRTTSQQPRTKAWTSIRKKNMMSVS